MSLDRPSDYHRVVRANIGKTRGFILAERHPCLDIRNKEVEAIHRDLQPAFAAKLAGLRLPTSWLFAGILCPGDTTDEVAAWASALPARDLDRVRFYAHPNVDMGEALAGWVEAHLPPPRVDECGDWKEFHRRFGLNLNDMAYQDAMQPKP
jgi:hypothetical protein